MRSVLVFNRRNKYFKSIKQILQMCCKMWFSAENIFYQRWTWTPHTVFPCWQIQIQRQDEEFLEVLSQLNFDIVLHNTNDLVFIIGTLSIKSSKRRYEAMQHFLEYFSLKTILMSENPTFHHNNQTSESQVDHILIFIFITNLRSEYNLKLNSV